MLRFSLLLLAAVRAAFLARTELVGENLALRHQLSTFVHCGRRPRVGVADRVLWVTLRRVWARWAEVLLFVRPETLVRWHLARVRYARCASGLALILPGCAFWMWMSQRSPSVTGSISSFEERSRWKAGCATWCLSATRASARVRLPWWKRSVCGQRERRAGALG